MILSVANKAIILSVVMPSVMAPNKLIPLRISDIFLVLMKNDVIQGAG
jgi:hypothetical protein